MKQKGKFNLGIVGLGMVGSPLARYFQELKGYKRGVDLFLYDKDLSKDYNDDVGKADIIFVCVPTPRAQDGSCDLSAVVEVFSKIKQGKIVVIKSTVTPGTTEKLQKEFPHLKVLFSPEFLTETRAWEDTVRPDRQIVGFTEGSLDAANAVLSVLPKAPFMSPWGLNTYRPIKITATEAEIIKYGGNIHFVRKVNWANALAGVCEKLGVEYENVRAGMAADHRIGDSHLDVSHGGYRGWGGYCFPKDLDAFTYWLSSSGLSHEANLLIADKKFNENILEDQNLTLADVSMHIHEWEKKKPNLPKETGKY